MSWSKVEDVRWPLSDKVQLAWEFPSGNTNVQQSSGVEIGPRSMWVRASHALAPRTRVWFRCSTGFSGTASVRDCKLANGGASIVLEFLGGLIWRGSSTSCPAGADAMPAAAESRAAV